MLTIHTRRIILAMFMPGLCLLVALLFNNEVYRLLLPVYTSLPYLPYLLLLAGLVMAWGHNNGREFDLLITLGLTYWTIRQYIWSSSIPAQSQSILFALLCVMIPLSFIIHALLPDKGVWRWQIAKRLGITLLQVALVIILLKYQHPQLLDWLRFNLWQSASPKLVTLTQPGLVVFLVAMVLLTSRLFFKLDVLRSGNLMGLFGVMLALNHVGTPSMAMVHFSIASGAILLSVILNSYNLAYLDELTELPSRRALKQQLMAMGKRYSIAMIDIDHFKQFNDRFGHDIGDQALRKVAKHLRQVTGGGKVYRFGGEEFTIVFSNKEAHEVLVHVDALREAIENNPFYVRSKRRPRTRPEEPVKPDKIRKVKITISAGIAQRAEQHTDPFEVIKSADKALYTAKRAGRNRVHAI